MINNFFKLSIIVLLLVVPFYSYGNNGGSSYSRYGLGDIRYIPSNQAIGMGGAGISILANSTISRCNPAAWSRLNNTMFSASALYEGFSAKNSKSSVFLSSMDFDGIMLAIPIATRSGIILGSGITSYSSVNYNINSTGSFTGIDYMLEHSGSGGLSQAHLGLSMTLLRNLHIGTKLNYYFGTIHHKISQRFNGSDYTSSYIDRTTRLKGIGYTFGAIYSGLRSVDVLPEEHSIHVGIMFSPTVYLNSSNEKFFEYTNGSTITRDTLIENDSKVRLPYSFGVGVSYQMDRTLLAGDFYYQNWSRFDARGIDHSNYRDSYRFGAGCEFSPSRESSAPFLSKLAYQIGAFYNATYYSIKGEPINEIGLTGGIGVPIFRDTKMYIAAEYSFRGTTDNGLQKDKILRLSFSLNGSERWFVQPEED